jgi:hypothetical protein
MTPFCTNQPIAIRNAERCCHMSQAQYSVIFCTSHCKPFVCKLLTFFIGSTVCNFGYVTKRLDTEIRLLPASPHEGSYRDLVTQQNIWRVSTLLASNSLHISALVAKLFIHILYRLCSLRTLCTCWPCNTQASVWDRINNEAFNLLYLETVMAEQAR